MSDRETNRQILELVRNIRTSTLIRWLVDEEQRPRILVSYGILSDQLPMPGSKEFDRRSKVHIAFENAIEDEIDRRSPA
jgi:hypothetical protein